MKTRTTKKTSTQASKAEQSTSKTNQQLPQNVSNPPKLFILPKDTSAEARIATLPNPATSVPNRYLVCPEKGFYEFTRIAAPKRVCRSWLLASEQTHPGDDSATETQEQDLDEKRDGYVLQTPELMVATHIDPMFVLLPALAEGNEEARGMQMFLSPSDYFEKLEQRSSHFRQIMRRDRDSGGRLERVLESRLMAVCKEMDAGGEKLYKISNQKLLEILVSKVKRTVEMGVLPASMEEQLVQQALIVPMLSVKREESGMSLAPAEDEEESGAIAGASQDDASSAQTSQDTQTNGSTSATASTAATSIPPTPVEESASVPSEEIVHLLRLRTALSFMMKSYVPKQLHNELETLLNTNKQALVDFDPLVAHLSQIDKLKKEAQALRTLSENISRKRGIEDDEDALEKAEAKKRKKEEEEFKKKNTSRGVKALGKADTSGMKKLSAFFGKPATKKG